MIPLLLALPFLIQEDEAAARAVLEACAGKLRESSALFLLAETVPQVQRGGTPANSRTLHVLMKRPNLLRITASEGGTNSLFVCDGRTLTHVPRISRRPEYTQFPVGDSRASLPLDPVIALYLGPELQNAFEFPG